MIWKLNAILNHLAARRQRQRFHGGLAITWWLGFAAGLLLWNAGVPARSFLPVLGLLLLVATAGIFIWSRRGMGDPRQMAKEIERKHPELQTELLAALDQNPDPASGSLTFLQNRVIVDSLASAERDHWLDLVPRPRLTALRALHLTGAFLFIITACVMLFPRAAKTQAAEEAVKKSPASMIEMSVDPGDVEIERGNPLTIQVRFDANPPASATLEITDEAGVRNISLERPFTDPVFQTRLSAVTAPMSYRVIIPEGASRSYTVRVYELPALRQSEVVLHFPGHLGKPSETIKDPHAIQAVDRTRMELSLVTNLPGLSATLVAKNREPLKLSSDSVNHRVSEILTRSVRYEIVLTDSAGRRNHRKDILDIKVIPNKPPVVQVLLPRKNEKVTPIQEVRLEARIKDDVGILAHGLRYTLDGEKWQEIEGNAAPGEKQPLLSHLVDLEAAGAKPNDVLMWNVWAEDLGPDGNKRRVTGDIHLVRVRNFDEEFYQRAAPPGETGPPPPGGDNLVKLQTKILNSTWNLRRDHAEITVTPPPAAELDTLHRSQEIAIEMAGELEAETTDPALRQFVTDARLEMKSASTLLAEAHTKTSVSPLEPAIGHEQAALRHLYRLMGSKTMIMQSEGESSASSSEDTPKEDLDLKPLNNPYQNEKTAKPEVAQQANEAMETLKRLDELAKRQSDLNEEMKALQMAANEANTPEKKAEIERQLKQLREQQRELLADVDKLQQKTAESAPDQKEALDAAREKAQQAGEQLEKEKLGDALAAGRRAQESLEKLHDDFRETSAAKLAQQLRDLRQDARDLEERQRQLAENSNPQPEAPMPNRLGNSGDSDADIARQQEDYKKLTDALRETAETAERAEPLVAKDLVEALRQADQNGIAKALEKAGQSGDDKAAQKAAEGIGKLTREIETAAERILGNEAQALRYARDELNRLAEQAGARPGQPSEEGQSPGQGNNPRDGGQPEEDKQPGQTAGESKTPGEREQPGQGEGKTPGQGNDPGQTAGTSPQPGEDPPGQGKGKSPGEGQGEGQGQTAGQGQGQPRGERPGQKNGPGEGGDSRTSRGGIAISGDGYEKWRDRLADLEAVVTDPDAQSAVARARKAGQEMRRDFKRHSKEPDPARIQDEILKPLAEAAKELDARLRDLDREDPLAPVGRDPVPDRYSEIVRRYFEELGK
jgi:hypothetical protein